MNETKFSVVFEGDATDFSAISAIFSQCGFVRVENVFTCDEIGEMQSAISQIVDNFQPESHPKSIFSTEDEQKHTADRYFLESVDRIRFFYEEGAIDKQSGQFLTPKHNSLNKVGHALHWLDGTFRKHTFASKIQRTFRELRFVEPKVVQSMYIFKQPSIGGAVAPHVDATFLHAVPTTSITHATTATPQPTGTQRNSVVVGVWIAVDAATADNGCLWFVPGSHKCKRNYRFVRSDSTNNENEKSLLKFIGTKPDYDSLHYVPMPVSKGSLLLIDGNVVHKSEANTSPKSRHAYTFHVFEKKNFEWPPSNWIQETENYKFPALYS